VVFISRGLAPLAPVAARVLDVEEEAGPTCQGQPTGRLDGGIAQRSPPDPGRRITTMFEMRTSGGQPWRHPSLFLSDLNAAPGPDR
jgi:hypothetical protein